MKPIMANIVQVQEASTKCLPEMSVMNEARKVPEMMANMVNDVKRPLAFVMRSESTISGTMPYFEGLKIALCRAIKNKVA